MTNPSAAQRAIYIAFGANLGKPHNSFLHAAKLLQQRGVSFIAASGLWQSPAWPAGHGQPDYINACAKISFSGTARELLSILHEVEAEMGRVRGQLNAPRVLDLDLIDFKGQVIEADDIKVPHPRMMTRGFVLFPLAQIAPNWTNPYSGQRSETSIDIALAKLPLADVAPIRSLGRAPFL